MSVWFQGIISEIDNYANKSNDLCLELDCKASNSIVIPQSSVEWDHAPPPSLLPPAASTAGAAPPRWPPSHSLHPEAAPL